MKVESKIFEVYRGQRPNILLIGNGINRAFNDVSWNEFLDLIKDNEKFPYDSNEYNLPMPLKATMLTNDRFCDSINNVLSEYNSLKTETPISKINLLKRIMDLNFDYVLTTNYTYEIEEALIGDSNLSNNQITKMQKYIGVERAENIYHFHTFNRVERDNYNNDIWHIHGQLRKPGSIVADHNMYCRLITNYAKLLDTSLNLKIKGKEPIIINDWVNAFVYGNVYILGFGLDYSEIDLWWLINYKSNNKNAGNTYFFEPKKEHEVQVIDENRYMEKREFDRVQNANSSYCKKQLLTTLNVKIKDFGLEANTTEGYLNFYRRFCNEFSYNRLYM